MAIVREGGRGNEPIPFKIEPVRVLSFRSIDAVRHAVIQILVWCLACSMWAVIQVVAPAYNFWTRVDARG
jgi:hypothetical protein